MLIISFESTHHAMFAEKMLNKAAIEIMVVPTPRQIDKSCGISIKIKDEDMQEAVKTLAKYNIEVKGIYRLQGESAEQVYPKQ